MSQTQKNAELVTEIFRAFEAGKVDRCRELVSPACKIRIAGNTLDREGWLGFGTMFMTAFPDGQHVWESAEAVGDYVLLNGYFTGTHRAPFQGIPPTGKSVKFSATLIDKVIDGKLVEHRGDFDSAGLMQQLGVLPA
jgi:predicted ester cyclase